MAIQEEIKTIPVIVDVPEDTIDSLLTSAFEGGSNYWYRVEKKISGKEDKAAGCQYLGDYVLKGHGLIISDFYGAEKGDRVEKTLDREAVCRGLKIMADKYPHHFKDMMNDDGDATTGDVFLQCCLYGEIIYG